MFWRSMTRHDAWCSMMSFQTSNEESHHVQVCILHILVKKIIARVCVFLSVWGVQRVWSEQHFPPYKAWKPLAESSRWADQHPFGWAGSAFSFMSVCVCVCVCLCVCVCPITLGVSLLVLLKIAAWSVFFKRSNNPTVSNSQLTSPSRHREQLHFLRFSWRPYGKGLSTWSAIAKWTPSCLLSRLKVRTPFALWVQDPLKGSITPRKLLHSCTSCLYRRLHQSNTLNEYSWIVFVAFQSSLGVYRNIVLVLLMASCIKNQSPIPSSCFDCGLRSSDVNCFALVWLSIMSECLSKGAPEKLAAGSRLKVCMKGSIGALEPWCCVLWATGSAVSWTGNEIGSAGSAKRCGLGSGCKQPASAGLPIGSALGSLRTGSASLSSASELSIPTATALGSASACWLSYLASPWCHVSGSCFIWGSSGTFGCWNPCRHPRRQPCPLQHMPT